MNDLSPYHSYIDDLLSQSNPVNLVFDEKILAVPIKLSSAETEHRKASFGAISEFFTRARNIFRRCVFNESDSDLKNLLINDSANQIPLSFYHGLPDEVWTNPVFFRTDESRLGIIFEIQCPGSGWGDLLLLRSLYKNYCRSDALVSYDPGAVIVGAVQAVCRSRAPAVLHLLDNSSNPSSMQYLIRCTQPPLRYWGYTKGMRNSECCFVRSHSVYGLVAENLFRHRIRLAAEGKLIFDLPPLLIFDQKMILCLPFLDGTKDEFSDEIREVLAYTYPISPRGFRDLDGQWVAIESFLNRPPKHRRYFLKYGGCDTTLNWGSRAVFRLDSNEAPGLIEVALRDTEAGRPWVIQPDVSSKENVMFYSRQSSEPASKTLTAKYSAFYGPSGLVGIRTHHRQSTKVHGQVDAIVGLAI
jgi:hypothetical protein